MKLRYIIPILIMIGATFMWASNNDYEDALRDQDEYCKNVGDGVWPDFKSIAKEVCHGPQRH